MTAADNSEKIEPDTALKNDAPLQDKIYPSGWKFLLITLGIMAAVLVVALDDYIISTGIPRLAADFKSINLTGCSPGDSASLNLPIGSVAFLLIVFFLEPPELSELGKSLTIKQKIMRIAFLAFSYLQVRLQDCATIPIRALRNFTPLLCLLYQLFVSMVIAIRNYYLPFYFQSVIEHAAASSGVLTLPYAMTLLFSPIASGAYITAYGHYIPIMYIGACLAVVGSELLSTLTITSSQAQYVGYQVIVALGAGTVQQIAFTAVPLALPPADVATASALVSFCNSIGPVLALTVGNILFTNIFGSKLAKMQGLN
ncbi:hypothetical protein EAF00_011702 [Botryotinia globosa]|nr:hypothetical protein EAF00_011702 [Botryotinia globosa]